MKKKRVTIADIAREAGVGTATVDRVLNGRLPVRAKTKAAVLNAAKALQYHGQALIRHRIEEAKPNVRLGFILQKKKKWFYRNLSDEIRRVCLGSAGVSDDPHIEFVDALSPDEITSALRQLGGKVDALGVVSIEHPRINAEIEAMRREGVACVAMLSDLTCPDLAGFVGINGRKAGRTAGWAIARLAPVEGTVGVLVGSHRYLSQGDRELGFRTYMRENAPRFSVADSIVYLDDSAVSYEATCELLRRYPAMVGLYHCGGGIEGALRAVEQEGKAGDMILICHELTPGSRRGLLNNTIDLVLASPPREIAGRLVDALVRAGSGKQTNKLIVEIEFNVYTPENI